MTLTQMKYVEAVNRYKSFTRAAQALYVSQPTISTMIHDLEEELQIEIFQRGKKGLALTSDGKRLLEHIGVILNQETLIHEQFSVLKSAKQDTFSISSQHYPLVSSVFCDYIQNRGADAYDYHLRITSTTNILNDVSQQISEIGILAMNDLNSGRMLHFLEENGLCFHPLLKTEARVFLSATHPLAEKERLTMADLEPWPCFYYDQNDDVLPCFAEEIRLPEHRPQKKIYISDQFSVIDLFVKLNAYNIGTGIIPHVNSSELDLTSIPLEGYPSITLGWISENRALSKISAEFLKMFESRLLNYTF